MRICGVTIGTVPEPLTVHLAAGLPAVLALAVEGEMDAPVIEWATSNGEVHSSHPLAREADGWSLSLAADEVDRLAGVQRARILDGRPLLAGPVVWSRGWDGACARNTQALQVVGVKGDQGDPAPPPNFITSTVPSPYGSPPQAWVTGEYPNLELTFAIPYARSIVAVSADGDDLVIDYDTWSNGEWETDRFPLPGVRTGIAVAPDGTPYLGAA